MAVDQPTQKEIDIFIQAIEMNPAIVSLSGYAEVNRELLTSVSKWFQRKLNTISKKFEIQFFEF